MNGLTKAAAKQEYAYMLRNLAETGERATNLGDDDISPLVAMFMATQDVDEVDSYIAESLGTDNAQHYPTLKTMLLSHNSSPARLQQLGELVREMFTSYTAPIIQDHLEELMAKDEEREIGKRDDMADMRREELLELSGFAS